LLATKQESVAIHKRKWDIQAFCRSDFTESISELNASGNPGDSLVWTGSVIIPGVYSLFLVNCGLNKSIYQMNVSCRNPNSHLDSRDEMLPGTYRFCAVIDFCFFGIWIINAVKFLNFRIRLHTLFLLFPIIRAVSLTVSASKWDDLRVSDSYPFWKECVTVTLEFLFYTLLLCGVAAASAGMWIFRSEINKGDWIEIILSSVFLTISILMIGHSPNFTFIVTFVVFTIFSMLWYFRHSLVNLIIATNLLKSLQTEPQIRAKIGLSQNFVSSTFLTMFGSLTMAAVVGGMDLQQGICAAVWEAGVICSLLVHQKFLLLRSCYSGEDEEPAVSQKRKEISLRKVHEPGRGYLACVAT
jgi:hypothetical protein